MKTFHCTAGGEEKGAAASCRNRQVPVPGANWGLYRSCEISQQFLKSFSQVFPLGTGIGRLSLEGDTSNSKIPLFKRSVPSFSMQFLPDRPCD